MSKEQTPAASSRRIPDFATRDEEAAWWDFHSISDYLGELQPVKATFARHLSDPVAMRLDPQDRAEITHRATAQGIGPSTLIRMWVKERLRQEVEADAGPR